VGKALVDIEVSDIPGKLNRFNKQNVLNLYVP